MSRRSRFRPGGWHRELRRRLRRLDAYRAETAVGALGQRLHQVPGIDPVATPEQCRAGFEQTVGVVGAGPVVGDADVGMRRDPGFRTPAGPMFAIAFVPADFRELIRFHAAW